MEDLYVAFCRTLARYGMLDGARSVLIGLSGGADSVVLTDLFLRYAKEHGIAVYALHLHHGIRGAQADRDADFCRELCQEEQIPFKMSYADIPALAKKRKRGTEETARNERRRILEAARAELGADRIALAHNANDVLETMLFRLARGTTGEGLCGIPPVNGNVIRPLITCTREQIEAYAEAHGLTFVHDSTNDDLRYTRNYIRHEIIPRMEHINAKAVQNAARCAMSLYEDRTENSSSATEETDARLCRRILSFCYANGCGELGSVHATAVLRLLRDGTTGDRVCFPGSKCAVRSPRGFYISETDEHVTPPFDLPLERGKTYTLPGGGLLLWDAPEKDINAATNIYKLAIQATVDFDKICGQARACSRKRDDTLLCFGHHRSVRKLLQKDSLPTAVRAQLPVVRDDAGVLWLPTSPVRDDCRAQGKPNVYFFGDVPKEFIL